MHFKWRCKWRDDLRVVRLLLRYGQRVRHEVATGLCACDRVVRLLSARVKTPDGRQGRLPLLGAVTPLGARASALTHAEHPGTRAGASMKSVRPQPLPQARTTRRSSLHSENGQSVRHDVFGNVTRREGAERSHRPLCLWSGDPFIIGGEEKHTRRQAGTPAATSSGYATRSARQRADPRGNAGTASMQKVAETLLA